MSFLGGNKRNAALLLSIATSPKLIVPTKTALFFFPFSARSSLNMTLLIFSAFSAFSVSASKDKYFPFAVILLSAF